MQFRRDAWGLERVLFSVKPPAEPFRHKVFAARDKEFERAEVAVLDAPRNLLISGLFGIGKTIFIKELLAGLTETSDVLAVYTCLEDRTSDLLTTILRRGGKTQSDSDRGGNHRASRA